MYYPYFRGKQYELLAIKELVQRNKIDNKVIPIIEPVNEDVKKLNDFKKILNQEAKKFVIIKNPQVGDYKGQVSTKLTQKSPMIGEIINSGSSNVNNIDIAFPITNLSQKRVAKLSQTADIATSNSQYVPKKDRLILFEDKFHKQSKNEDYLRNPDEFFSSDNKKYKEINAKGFGDYSIVGSKFQRSGGQAKEVSIHIVYLDEEDDIRVRHFTSNLGNGTSNLDKKIQTVIRDFCKWYENQSEDNHSIGANEIKKRLDKPVNLAKLKQYSIMHHLEIIDNYLNKNI